MKFIKYFFQATIIYAFFLIIKLIGLSRSRKLFAKIFNKIGLAYGFTIDNAYIVDLDNNVEFFLTAVIYSNSNEVMNDNMYDYESISIPFLSELGRKIYNYESKREKSNFPK